MLVRHILSLLQLVYDKCLITHYFNTTIRERTQSLGETALSRSHTCGHTCSHYRPSVLHVNRVCRRAEEVLTSSVLHLGRLLICIEREEGGGGVQRCRESIRGVNGLKTGNCRERRGVVMQEGHKSLWGSLALISVSVLSTFDRVRHLQFLPALYYTFLCFCIHNPPFNWTKNILLDLN